VLVNEIEGGEVASALIEFGRSPEIKNRSVRLRILMR
jgi:hypothetical protein